MKPKIGKRVTIGYFTGTDVEPVCDALDELKVKFNIRSTGYPDEDVITVAADDLTKIGMMYEQLESYRVPTARHARCDAGPCISNTTDGTSCAGPLWATKLMGQLKSRAYRCEKHATSTTVKNPYGWIFYPPKVKS